MTATLTTKAPLFLEISHGHYCFSGVGYIVKDNIRSFDVLKVSNDGSKIVELVYPMLTPNGVGLSPDEKTVYVADTESSRLFAFDIVEPGIVRTEHFPAPFGGLPPGANIELGEDPADVGVDRSVAEEQVVTNLAVGPAQYHQAQHVELAGCQVGEGLGRVPVPGRPGHCRLNPIDAGISPELDQNIALRSRRTTDRR